MHALTKAFPIYLARQRNSVLMYNYDMPCFTHDKPDSHFIIDKILYILGTVLRFHALYPTEERLFSHGYTKLELLFVCSNLLLMSSLSSFIQNVLFMF